MKYVTLMSPGFVPVSVLFSHHLTHDEMMKKLGLQIIGAGVVALEPYGKAPVERCVGTGGFSPDFSFDPELIAHDFQLTSSLSRLIKPSNLKSYVPH